MAADLKKSNSFGEAKYEHWVVTEARGEYYKIYYDGKCVTTPFITIENKNDREIRSIVSCIKTFMYYVNNGANAAPTVFHTAAIKAAAKKLGLNNVQELILFAVDSLKGKSVNADAVISFLKGTLGDMFYAFTIGDLVIVIVNTFNCKDEFYIIKDKVESYN